jgi:hypothetical protein
LKPTTAAVFVVALQQVILCARLSAQVGQPASATQIVNQMLQAEVAAWRNRQHFLYRNEERSNRTNGRLWDELVVETSDGSMQRLISEDGKPLSGNQKIAEDRRIAFLANHPGEFRRKTQRRKEEDEARMPELLREIPNIFLFNSLGSEGDYTIVKDYVHREKLHGREMFIPLTHPAGEGQADFEWEHNGECCKGERLA